MYDRSVFIDVLIVIIAGAVGLYATQPISATNELDCEATFSDYDESRVYAIADENGRLTFSDSIPPGCQIPIEADDRNVAGNEQPGAPPKVENPPIPGTPHISTFDSVRPYLPFLSGILFATGLLPLLFSRLKRILGEPGIERVLRRSACPHLKDLVVPAFPDGKTMTMEYVVRTESGLLLLNTSDFSTPVVARTDDPNWTLLEKLGGRPIANPLCAAERHRQALQAFLGPVPVALRVLITGKVRYQDFRPSRAIDTLEALRDALQLPVELPISSGELDALWKKLKRLPHDNRRSRSTNYESLVRQILQWQSPVSSGFLYAAALLTIATLIYA